MEIGMNFEINFFLLSSLFLELLPFEQNYLPFNRRRRRPRSSLGQVLEPYQYRSKPFLPDHVLLYHFHLDLSKEAAIQLDLSLEGSFTHNSISEGKSILEKILENTPYIGIYDEFAKETIESGSDQQKEAYAAEPKIPSNPSYDSVAKEPPIQGTHHTSRDDESHPFTCPFEFEDALFLDVDPGNTLEPPNSTSSYASNSYMRHQEHSKDGISSEPIEGE